VKLAVFSEHVTQLGYGQKDMGFKHFFL